MLKYVLVSSAILGIAVVIGFRGLMLGPGQWLVLDIVPCDNPELYWPVDISRQKINRTHDSFTISMDFDNELNFSYAGFVDAYQKLDGGFKFYQKIESDCTCTFLKKYAKENMERFLANAHYDPPDCPLPAGPFRVTNFVMDYTELPKHGVYGTFLANAYLVYKEEKVGCVKIILNFDERTEDDDDDDDFDFF
ncbi:uncharacterized protein LOC135118151 [Helicoverpa armigera]|uniref:uncharacterized protein LOC135118151 n=1 Tax=Helicoverpa armigera TaxID=29058 RepID=UPI003083BEC2